MLVQIALVVFALLGLMSLVIDIGLVRLTQGQMQSAADAAALEGLRYRDIGVVDPATGESAPNVFASDCLRRAAAHRAVRQVFDDDLDLATEDPNQPFGAGPVFGLTGGATSLQAYQTLSVPDPRVYEPRLQFNQVNVTEGDMVSGRYCYSADPTASESVNFALPGMVVCEDPQRGAGRYARNDFNPNDDPPAPPPALPECPGVDEPLPDAWPASPGSLADVDHNAFLVRLRRSNELQDLPAQTDLGVASSGPSLPLLFGRGTTIRDDPESTYSARRDGLTVRATAIADSRPAVHVGLPRTNPVQPGVMPYAIVDTFVGGLPGTPVPVTINPANGLICTGLVCVGAAPATNIGRFIDALLDPTRANWLNVSRVGQQLPGPVPLACALALPAQGRVGFGPIYSLIGAGPNFIIGFVSIALRRDPARPANPCAGVLARGSGTMAWSNATALAATGFAWPVTLPAAQVRELLDKHLARPGRVQYGPLVVPTLAR